MPIRFLEAARISENQPTLDSRDSVTIIAFYISTTKKCKTIGNKEVVNCTFIFLATYFFGRYECLYGESVHCPNKKNRLPIKKNLTFCMKFSVSYMDFI